MRRCRPLLGTFVEIEAEDSAAIDLAFAAVDRVHLLMSAHDPHSELGRLNRGERVMLSNDTRTVLDRARFWFERSDGLFDPIVAGRCAIASGAIPLHRGQSQPDPATRFDSLCVAEGDAWLRRPGCIDLGGIAKGHAVDVAVAALRGAGMSSGLVNAGGDLFAFGSPQRITIPHPWTRRPLLEIQLDNRALATSAGLAVGGALEFDHLPARNPGLISVTVEAARAIDADALTKIAFAGHPRLDALLAIADARALAVTASGATVEHSAERLAA